MSVGVVVGKFWPLHNGHVALLDFAAARCNHLDVILVQRASEVPDAKDRALAIYDELSDLEWTSVKVHIVDDLACDDSKEGTSQAWADYTKNILGYYPDRVFSSEEYGPRWAGLMGAKHIEFDPERVQNNISGTQVRQDYSEASDSLPGATKALVLPRVVVMGAESSGTTTLANDLGKHYNTPVVPEVGRIMAEEYRAEHGEAPPLDFWTECRFKAVSKGQDALENRLAREANRVLICDTDSLATAVWWKRYHPTDQGMYSALKHWGHQQALKHHDLYLITTINGVPWEDDGTRDGPKERKWMEKDFVDAAVRLKLGYGGTRINTLIMYGSKEKRLDLAVSAIDELLEARRSK